MRIHNSQAEWPKRSSYIKGGGGGGGGGCKGQITKFHCFEATFTSISCCSETTIERGRGKSVHFLKALFSEVNVSRLRQWRYLKYLAPYDTTARHMQQNEYSLKTNVFFYLKAEDAENFSTWFSDP